MKSLITLEAPSKGENELSSIYALDDKEAQALRNIDIDSVLGTISTRDLLQEIGLGAITSGNEILAIHFYELNDGSFYLIATDGVNIYSSLAGTGAWSLLNSGKPLTAGKPIPSFLNIDNSLWITNGYDKVAQWKDATTYRYLDGATVAGVGTLVTTASANVVGTGTAFTTALSVGDTIAASDGQTRMVLSITDNTHCKVDSAPSPDWAAATFTVQTTPNVPKGELIAYDKSSVIVAKIDTSPLSVRFSLNTYGGIFIKPDQSQAWPAAQELIAPAAYGAALRGIATIKGTVSLVSGLPAGRILLFKDSSMYTLSGTSIADYRFDLFSSDVGTRYKRSICTFEDQSIGFAGELGLYKTNGQEMTLISNKKDVAYSSLSRNRTTVGSYTFSQAFNGFTFSHLAVGTNVVKFADSNLSGTATSAATHIITNTAKDWLTAHIQAFADGATVLVELRAAASSGGLASASYVTITDNAVPSLTINTWVQLRITLTRTALTQNPVLTFVQLNFESYVALAREPYMVFNNSETIFGFDTEYENLRISLNRFGAWTTHSEVTEETSCGIRYRGVVYYGSKSGKVYSAYAEVGATGTLDVESQWRTIPITAQKPHLRKSLDYIVLFAEGEPFKSIIVDCILDGVMRVSREYSVSETPLRETKLWLPQGTIFKTLELVLRSKTKQKISSIGRIDLGVRIIEGDEGDEGN